MKGPLSKVLLLACVLVGIGLWAGVKWFLSDTDDFSERLDIRSVAFVKKEPGSSAKAVTPAASATPTASVEPLEVLARNTRAAKAQAAVSDEGVQPEQEQEESQPGDEDDELTDAQIAENAEEDAESQALPVVELVEGGEIEQRETSDDDEIEAITLSKDELDVRESARRARYAELGLIPKKTPKPTIAVDVALEMPERCAGAAVARVPVALKFRYETSTMRGESLSSLESLVALFRECGSGEFLVTENPLGRVDATDLLKQMRFDEVKYFFIQHSVSIDTVQFPEE